jgi:hypothetical protein
VLALVRQIVRRLTQPRLRARWPSSNSATLNCNEKTNKKPNKPNFAAPAYRFDAAETGLPVVYPSGSEIHAQSAEAALAPPEDHSGLRVASRAVGWLSGAAHFRFLPWMSDKLELANSFGLPRREPPRKLSSL